MLHRFSFRLKQQQIAPKKVYCVDSGMSNAVSFRVSGDLGAQMENLVASELLRRRDYFRSGLEIYYWKDARQREVDFVLKEGPAVVGLVQSCYDPSDAKTRDREIRALIEASRQLRCRNLIALTWDYEAEHEAEGRKIRFRPLWKWLMEPPVAARE
jgi:predicted AAA+ superfamily ATPase